MGLNVEEEKNESVKEIEQCCIEWRARRVKPHWVELSDAKIDGGSKETRFKGAWRCTHCHIYRTRLCTAHKTFASLRPSILRTHNIWNVHRGTGHMREERHRGRCFGIYQVWEWAATTSRNPVSKCSTRRRRQRLDTSRSPFSPRLFRIFATATA